jgi:photosystem II stability/assembly factor-like uncharacterized protein
VPPRSWILLPLAALLLGLFFAAQRVQAPESEEPLEPLGLPGVREYRVLVVDDVDPKVLLLGTERGIFRTRDGGIRWYLVGLDGRVIDAIVRDDGEYVAGGDGVSAISHDRGQTWASTTRTPPRRQALVRSELDPRYVLDVREGFRRSLDSGETWTDVALDAAAAAWSPTSPRDAYAVGNDGQLYRTRDAGATWDIAG